MSVVVATWLEANQRCLVAEIEVVRTRLQARVDGEACDDGALAAALEEREAAERDAPAPAALPAIARALGLTAFERDLLAGAAAAELDADVARLCARAHGDPARNQLTFALAQAIFDEPHWSALTPGRPLRSLRLLELGPGPLPSCPLAVAERVLHQLFGIEQIDEQLLPWLTPLPPPGPLSPTLGAAAARLAGVWSEPLPPVAQVLGARTADRRLVIAAAAASCGLVPWSVSAAELSSDPVERDAWWRLAQRELLLDGIVLVVEIPDDPAPAVADALRRLETVVGTVVLSAEAAHRLDRPTIAIATPRLRPREQRELWRRALGDADSASVDGLVRAFDLGAAEIAGVAASAGVAEGEPGPWLWDACRRATRPALDGLAQRVRSQARWEDLVLPPDQGDAVRTIVAHAPHRLAVAEAFSSSSRGHGLVALFAGPSGTGKTLAAEVIANELGLDLFRVDLSSVVSKWIGETEKHLRTILDAADRGSAVLLFDEADALFGKRSEVRDSHDRFANIEVGYLLQRLETYRGIAVLTTNMRSAVDSAFTRRIRYVVQFPHPNAELRERIWQRAFPPGVTCRGLDFARLARLDLAGGSIHNIAVHAALDAAAAGSDVTVEHVRRGVLREYAKLERPLTEVEAVGLR